MLIAGGTAVVLATLVAEAALVASYPPIPGQSQDGLKGALAMIYLYIVCCREFILYQLTLLTVDRSSQSCFSMVLSTYTSVKYGLITSALRE